MVFRIFYIKFFFAATIFAVACQHPAKVTELEVGYVEMNKQGMVTKKNAAVPGAVSTEMLPRTATVAVPNTSPTKRNPNAKTKNRHPLRKKFDRLKKNDLVSIELQRV